MKITRVSHITNQHRLGFSIAYKAITPIMSVGQDSGAETVFTHADSLALAVFVLRIDKYHFGCRLSPPTTSRRWANFPGLDVGWLSWGVLGELC